VKDQVQFDLNEQKIVGFVFIIRLAGISRQRDLTKGLSWQKFHMTSFRFLKITPVAIVNYNNELNEAIDSFICAY